MQFLLLHQLYTQLFDEDEQRMNLWQSDLQEKFSQHL